jgi:two-component system cell cycle sensor histidine kinase/response regulator CckA
MIMAKKNIQAPRVIVVDDEPSVRNIVRRMLEPAGYVVEEAGDPKQACDAIAQGGPLDLLIADFHMPELTGDEVARRFRAAQPDVKVLFITGYADDLFAERSLLWEGEAFLEKPFSGKSLLEAASLLLFGRFNQETKFAAPVLAAGAL